MPNSQFPYSAISKLKNTWLFRRDTPTLSAKDVVLWWEIRRIPYNFIVGIVGIATCTLFVAVGLGAEIFFHTEFGIPDPPAIAILAVLLYGIMANVCYTGGWIVELTLLKIRPQKAAGFASVAFYRGLIFSVFLTFLPAVFLFCISVLKLVSHFVNQHH